MRRSHGDDQEPGVDNFGQETIDRVLHVGCRKQCGQERANICRASKDGLVEAGASWTG